MFRVVNDAMFTVGTCPSLAISSYADNAASKLASGICVYCALATVTIPIKK